MFHFFTALALAIGSLFGVQQPAPIVHAPVVQPAQVAPVVAQAAPEVKLGAYNPTGGGTYRLQSSIGTTNVTVPLSSFKEPISNIPYTMTYLNSSVGYGTLDPQQPTRSEFISFTGITQNGDGTAVLTGVTRGLSRSYPYTASTTLRQTHSGQSIFILSDSPQHFSEYAVKQNNETITGQWTFTNFPITASTSYASETTGGIVEIATGAEAASSTATGTFARLALPATMATDTYNTLTAGSKVVVTKGTGTIDPNFVSISASSTHGDLYGFFGDGSDGDATIGAGTTTITRDMYYNNLTLTGTLSTDGYRVYVKGTVSGAGKIVGATGNNGGAGGAGSGSGGTAGTAGASSGSGIFTTTAGSAGTVGQTAGTGAAGVDCTATIGIGSYGARGGTSGSAGAGGASSTPTMVNKFAILASLTFQAIDISQASIVSVIKGAGCSSGGGGGGGNGGHDGGGGGGGGGASGGLVWLVANTWSGTFIVAGGRGGNGGAGGNGAGTTDGGGGGGGGGSAGATVVIYKTKTWTGSYQFVPGTGGAASTGGSKGAGAVGSNGITGTSYEINANTLLR